MVQTNPQSHNPEFELVQAIHNQLPLRGPTILYLTDEAHGQFRELLDANKDNMKAGVAARIIQSMDNAGTGNQFDLDEELTAQLRNELDETIRAFERIMNPQKFAMTLPESVNTRISDEELCAGLLKQMRKGTRIILPYIEIMQFVDILNDTYAATKEPWLLKMGDSFRNIAIYDDGTKRKERFYIVQLDADIAKRFLSELETLEAGDA